MLVPKNASLFLSVPYKI